MKAVVGAFRDVRKPGECLEDIVEMGTAKEDLADGPGRISRDQRLDKALPIEGFYLPLGRPKVVW